PNWRHLRAWRSILRSEIRPHDIRERGKRSPDERMGAGRFAVRTGTRSDRRGSFGSTDSLPQGSVRSLLQSEIEVLPDPNEGLPAIVRNITSSANCERYLVITKYNGVVPGTKMEIKGIGAYSQGIGSFARHYHLFANVAVSMYDGATYEKINRSFAALGASFA